MRIGLYALKARVGRQVKLTPETASESARVCISERARVLLRFIMGVIYYTCNLLKIMKWGENLTEII